MKTWSRLFDLCLNLLSLAAAFFIVATIANRYFFSPPPEPALAEEPRPGAKLALPSVDWASNPKTLVLGLSTKCRYCSESAGFYHKLLRAASFNSVRTIAVFPQPVSEARVFLQEHNLTPDDVRQAKMRDVGMVGTPTVLLVDSSGRVQSSWVGELSPEREGEVFKELGSAVLVDRVQEKNQPSTADDQYLTAARFKDLLGKEAVVPVIDVRPREEYKLGHIADSLNVPLDELEPRARPEIPKWPTVVLYCNSCGSCDPGAAKKGLETRCTIGAFVMRREGFGNFRLLDESLARLKEVGIKVVEDTEKSRGKP